MKEKLIDYTGKLNNHKEYIKMLKKLEENCKYIEIVIIDEKENNELVNKFREDVISKEKVSKWWGTKTTAKNNLYKIKASNKLFKYLQDFETFCKYYESTEERGDYSEITDFGYDDIAFYGYENEYLLYTTTHEGYITVNRKLVLY